jgi:hypothetical protein
MIVLCHGFEVVESLRRNFVTLGFLLTKSWSFSCHISPLPYILNLQVKISNINPFLSNIFCAKYCTGTEIYAIIPTDIF